MKITKATELNNKKSCYLIYANPGMGKTTAIKFIKGKTLIIDIDKSSIVLKGEKNIDIVEVDTHNIFDNWISIVTELIKGAAKDYDNIVIDNVSELFRSCLANLGREGKNNRVPSQADYQRIDFTILDSLRALTNLNNRIIFTAWETSDVWTDESTGQMYNRSMPDIRLKILNNFLGLCDVVARLVCKKDESGEIIRGFILEPLNSVYAKNRLDNRKGCKVEELIQNV